MTQLRKVASIFLNVAIVVLAVMLFRQMGDNMSVQTRRARIDGEAAPRLLLHGDQFLLPQLQTGRNRTVVLYVSGTCVFCNESLPFYRAVASQISNGDEVALNVVSSDDENAIDRWLDVSAQYAFLQLDVDARNDSGLFATPTIVVLDEVERIELVWVGMMEEEQERAFLAAIAGGSLEGVGSQGGGRVQYVTEDDVLALAATSDVAVLATSYEQGVTGFELPGIERVIIPADEWPSRILEVTEYEHVILDCRIPGSNAACRSNALGLERHVGAPVRMLARNPTR